MKIDNELKKIFITVVLLSLFSAGMLIIFNYYEENIFNNYSGNHALDIRTLRAETGMFIYPFLLIGSIVCLLWYKIYMLKIKRLKNEKKNKYKKTK